LEFLNTLKKHIFKFLRFYVLLKEIQTPVLQMRLPFIL